MRATLIVVGGKATKGRLSLNLPIVIGRSRSADLTVAHPMISRRHCEIYDSSGLVMVRDLDSLNGTLVEGRKIGEAALRPDDEFTVGPLTFRVDYEYQAQPDGAEDVPAADAIRIEPVVEITDGSSRAQDSPLPPNGESNVPPELEETLLEDESSGNASSAGELPEPSAPIQPADDSDPGELPQ